MRKNLISLLGVFVLAFLPVQAGPTVSGHAGGYSGGSHASGGGYHSSAGAYHSYSGGYSSHGGTYPSYGGAYHGYGGTCHYYYGGGYRCYGGPYNGHCYYSACPSYGYYGSYYGPSVGIVYSSPGGYDYDSGYDASAYTPAPPPPDDAGPPPSPPTDSTEPVAASAPSLPVGKYDDSGFVHSPFSTATIKVDKVTDGEVFHDPYTGQSFRVHVPVAPPVAAPDQALTAPLPVGKYDEYGYVHSPFTTSTFKVQKVTDGEIFHDPVTGQSFQILVPPATPPPSPTPAK